MCSHEHLSIIERYYTEKYFIDLSSRQEDMCVLVHSNRVCVLTLAPTHPILQGKQTVQTVNFRISGETNRLDNKASGKLKKGAQVLARGAPLCEVTTTTGSKYMLKCGIPGSLLEVNEHLVANPGLLTSHPYSEGYVAIVLTRLADHEKLVAKLSTKEEYMKTRLAKSANDL